MISKKDIKNLKMIRMLKNVNKLLIKFNIELKDNIRETCNFVNDLIENPRREREVRWDLIDKGEPKRMTRR